MQKLLSSPKSLLLIFFGAFFLIILSTNLLVGGRIDLTENGLYTLSDGTKNIIGDLDKPVELTLYFSDKATTQLPILRTYANRVTELLQEYETLSNGKITFNQVDPVAFSEAEDEAALAGLQGVPGGARGDQVYFGLVARAEAESGDEADAAEEVIPFLQPDKEVFLEYELTRLISSLSNPNLPKIGIVSGIEINGGFDYMTRQSRPAWAIMQYIEESFEVQWIEDDATEIEGVDVLLLIGPQNVSDQLLFAIDQYVMNGGRTLAFLDPYSEAMAMQGGMPSVQRSDLEKLLPKWGVKLKEEAVLGDFQNSLVVALGQGREPTRHIGILGMGPGSLDSDDITLFGLESLNLSSVGYLEPQEVTGITVETLLKSSQQTQPHGPDTWLQLHDPQQLLSEFAPTGEEYIIAARLSGQAKTAFPDGLTYTEEVEVAADEQAIEGEEGAESEPKTETKEVKITTTHLETDNLNVTVVADTDILSDRLWVQVQSFFGQQIVTPWADNGSYLVNTLEYLSGHPDLIEIRSQGRFNRPFEKVEDLRRDAEERFLAQQELLEEELNATESKLIQLEGLRSEGDGAMFTPEQEQELLKFQEEKLKIRKQLRDVQHQLDQDIEALGTQLKLINILLVPAIICLFVFFGFMKRRMA